jgi:coenzyme F420-0:L-glutamate ligase/coenzyme F420-1:gamma-L-glutamate ligase
MPLLPLDPDASARRIRATLRERTGAVVAVIVADSFGRPFRHGTTDVAIGVAGMDPLLDLRGTVDRAGYVLRSSRVAIADELAAAADLARGKHDAIPVVVVRGVTVRGDGAATDLVMRPERDLFR